VSRTRLPRAEREAQILDAAHEQFAANGYGAVTMESVATEVGVTKPLLYAYFGNKERLYLACLERAGEAVVATVAGAFETAPGPAEGLRRGVRAFFSVVAEDRATWQVLYDETLPAGGEIARRVGAYRDHLTGVTADAMEAIAATGGARVRVEAEALAHGLLGAAEALVRWWLRTDALTAAEAAELLVATLETGLARRPPGRGPLRLPTEPGDTP
jgi:AcrR family transcriptional regulator